MTDPNENSPYFRVYAWQEGRTLSKRDIDDLCTVKLTPRRDPDLRELDVE